MQWIWTIHVHFNTWHFSRNKHTWISIGPCVPQISTNTVNRLSPSLSLFTKISGLCSNEQVDIWYHRRPFAPRFLGISSCGWYVSEVEGKPVEKCFLFVHFYFSWSENSNIVWYFQEKSKLALFFQIWEISNLLVFRGPISPYVTDASSIFQSIRLFCKNIFYGYVYRWIY